MQTTQKCLSFKNGFADSVTGGATLEQFWASYNAKYGTNYSAEWQELFEHAGYNDKLYFPYQNSDNGSSAYWLTSPHLTLSDQLGHVYCTGGVHYGVYNPHDFAIRPLVKLSNNAKMTWNGNAWDLSN